MENKICKNIFESAFDSFELDDGFLLKVDADLKKHTVINNRKDNDADKKFIHRTVNKSDVACKGNKSSEKKIQFEDLSIFLEDLNDSDFFERICRKNKKNSLKVDDNAPNKKEKIESPSDNVTCSLSPILGPKPNNKVNRSFSSTPLRPNNSTDLDEKKNSRAPEENFLKSSDYAYLEADLFDDWDAEGNSQKDSITLSQAFKLIEEAELARQSNQKENLNTSIDLLTGEPVGGDVEDLFAESFNLPNGDTVPKQPNLQNLVDKVPKKDSSDDCAVILEECNAKSKPPAAQKLNFEIKTDQRKDHFGIDFSSDDDLDFLTLEVLNKPECVKTPLKVLSPDESDTIIKKRGKCCRIIESDSAEDSPDLRFIKKWNKKKNTGQKSCKRIVAREFIESEAEVSDVVEVSSDEFEEEGDYDASFLDEELYMTQNCSADMTAKYLESLKNCNRPGQFKIPAPNSYNPAYIFSQVPEESNAEYELDSFCVNEVEEEMKTDLSELEVAENILEMDRKKKKRKRILQRSVKIK